MSYEKKTRFGQYLQVQGLGADDPWAEAASDTVLPDGTKQGVSQEQGGSSGGGGGLLDAFSSLIGGGSSTPKTPTKPSTTTQVGAGIGAFLKGLAAPPPKPVTPLPGYPGYPKPGMSTTTKLAIAGAGALVLVVLLTRD